MQSLESGWRFVCIRFCVGMCPLGCGWETGGGSSRVAQSGAGVASVHVVAVGPGWGRGGGASCSWLGRAVGRSTVRSWLSTLRRVQRA